MSDQFKPVKIGDVSAEGKFTPVSRDALDTLQPEVRSHIQTMDAVMVDSMYRPEWRTIRAELVRLQNEETALSDLVWRQAKILTGIANALKGEPGRLYAHSHHDLAEVAQSTVAELAALKARIAGSPACSVFTDAKVYCCVPRDWAGKRVRLLVEE